MSRRDRAQADVEGADTLDRVLFHFTEWLAPYVGGDPHAALPVIHRKDYPRPRTHMKSPREKLTKLTSRLGLLQAIPPSMGRGSSFCRLHRRGPASNPLRDYEGGEGGGEGSSKICSSCLVLRSPFTLLTSDSLEHTLHFNLFRR